jgi:hypothetical protein
MMDDRRDELVTFDRLSQDGPRINGAPLKRETIARWATHGVGGVRLETTKLGGRRLATREAFERFLKEVAGP